MDEWMDGGWVGECMQLEGGKLSQSSLFWEGIALPEPGGRLRLGGLSLIFLDNIPGADRELGPQEAGLF